MARDEQPFERAENRRQRRSRPPKSQPIDVDGDSGRQRRQRLDPAGDVDVDGSLPPIHRVVGQIAGSQQGIVTREQLLAAGLGADRIDHWLRCGRLVLRHRGVYALGHTAPCPFSAEAAAVLACGDGAVLSHTSAAFVWGLRPAAADGVVDVTVVGRRPRARAAIRVRRVSQLDGRDVCRREGIQITSPARTLLDIAQGLDQHELERALHEAVAVTLMTAGQMREVLARYPKRPGSGLLRELIEPGRPSGASRSGGEKALLTLIRGAGLPEPELNVRLGRWTVDFLWRRERLVVEVDGYDYHSSRWALDRDHAKDADLRAMELEVLRFTGRRVARRPLSALATTAQALARRGRAEG
jgi:very-short-patch-repair endonuclease